MAIVSIVTVAKGLRERKPCDLALAIQALYQQAAGPKAGKALTIAILAQCDKQHLSRPSLPSSKHAHEADSNSVPIRASYLHYSANCANKRRT